MSFNGVESLSPKEIEKALINNELNKLTPGSSKYWELIEKLAELEGRSHE